MLLSPGRGGRIRRSACSFNLNLEGGLILAVLDKLNLVCLLTRPLIGWI
jgi:hypothetical protein